MPNDAAFWQVFRSGIESAFVDYRMIIEYHDLSAHANETNMDAAQLMIDQIQALISNTSKTIDGIITTAPDPYAMLPILKTVSGTNKHLISTEISCKLVESK